MTITPADGQPPELLAGHVGVVLLYRGGWCPYGNARLRVIVSVYSSGAIGRLVPGRRHRPHEVCARAGGPRGPGMSGVLVEREKRVLCRISEAARVRRRR